MEKLKEFMRSPKKTAILGLIGSILMLANWIIYFTPFSILDEFCSICLIIYFIVILVRMFLQKGNLKFANYTLIISYIVTILMIIPNIKYIFNIVGIAYVLSLVTMILYLCNILLRKNNFVNNKIFAIVIIIYTLIQLISSLDTFNLFAIKYSVFTEEIIYIINYIGYLFIIPYFYNYYNVLKGENKNGK